MEMTSADYIAEKREKFANFIMFKTAERRCEDGNNNC